MSASFNGQDHQLIAHVAEKNLIILSKLLQTHPIIKFTDKSFKFNRKLWNTIKAIISYVINAIEAMMKKSFLSVIFATFIAAMFTAILH
jgi:hypothetical protein